MQVDSARMLPWSPAMAALFIYPAKLVQGTLLGSSRDIHFGTYTQDTCGVSHSIQVCMWSPVLTSMSHQQMPNFVLRATMFLKRPLKPLLRYHCVADILDQFAEGSFEDSGSAKPSWHGCIGGAGAGAVACQHRQSSHLPGVWRVLCQWASLPCHEAVPSQLGQRVGIHARSVAKAKRQHVGP